MHLFPFWCKIKSQVQGGERMDEQRVRIRDIADELGLSTATVSNVLHGKTKKVSEETVKRVQALLEERQYIPSMAGILLAQNSSRIIGVVINDHEKYEGHTLEDAFIASSLNHLASEIEKHSRFLMVKKTKDPEDIIPFASMWNMDGLVIIGFCDEDYHYLRNHMRIPFVIYDGYCENPERMFNITLDNYNGGFQTGALFKRDGHKHVLCISDNNICVDKERYEGFCAGFGGAGATDPELLLIPMAKKDRWPFYLRHLRIFRNVTAVFAVSDYYAMDLIRFLDTQGIRVPDDISVAGFDDIPLSSQISPTLTTVRQNGALRAEIAITKLLELRSGKSTETTVMLPVELVERESTGKHHR